MTDFLTCVPNSDSHMLPRLSFTSQGRPNVRSYRCRNLPALSQTLRSPLRKAPTSSHGPYNDNVHG